MSSAPKSSHHPNVDIPLEIGSVMHLQIDPLQITVPKYMTLELSGSSFTVILIYHFDHGHSLSAF